MPLGPGQRRLAGETSQQGAARECREKIGSTVDLAGHRPDITVTNENPFVDFYREQVPDLDLTTPRLQEEEVRAVRWADEAEVLNLFDEGRFWPYARSLIPPLFDAHRGPHGLTA